jgi:hypothetical protein
MIKDIHKAKTFARKLKGTISYDTDCQPLAVRSKNVRISNKFIGTGK